MRAIILCGGKGTRLKPYTISLPKPLVPLGDKPILEYIIEFLKKAGFDHITLALNHMSDIIRAYFQDGSKWNVTIDYSLEKKELSTMGPLKLINDLPGEFLVMNGDIISDINIDDMIKFHKKQKSIFTIGAFRRNVKIDFGVLKSKENKLIKFHEKPQNEFLVSMGVYYVNKKSLEFIPKDEPFGFDDLMNTFLEKSINPSIFIHEGHWLDIGRPSDYEAVYS